MVSQYCEFLVRFVFWFLFFIVFYKCYRKKNFVKKYILQFISYVGENLFNVFVGYNIENKF